MDNLKNQQMDAVNRSLAYLKYSLGIGAMFSQHKVVMFSQHTHLDIVGYIRSKLD